MASRAKGRRPVERCGRAARLGAVVATGVWLGCNAIIGLDLPEREASELCAGVSCTAVEACHLAGECDPATGVCSSPLAPNGTECDDGDLCTHMDSCQGGACTGTSTCPAANGCQPGCDTATGLCAAPDGTPCNDGSVCTTADTCQGGVCNPGEDSTWAHWVPDAPPGYVVTEDVVVDTTTGRTWQRAVPATSYTWQEAQTYCGSLSLPGYPSGWRLPTRIELVSIVDYTKRDPAIDTVVFPGTPSEPFWSSSLYAGGSSYAWHVYFDDGYVNGVSVDDTLRVRCIR